MKLRRLAAILAVTSLVVGAFLIVHGHELEKRTTSDIRVAARLLPTERVYARQLRIETKQELRLRATLRIARARGDTLARQRQRSWQTAWHAAFGPAKAAAYAPAYENAFPVALGRTEWYVLHVTTAGGYATKAWEAPNGQEYVIANGSVSSYVLGSAPSPYGTDYNAGGVPGYINSDGNWVPSPSSNPNLTPGGPTAICADGSYSYSQHASGTCSHHGGVSSWNP